MKVFAIGDTHLSGTPPKKPMDIFGPHWANHWEKIKQAWQKSVTNDDIVFIVGDISWALRLPEALEDLQSIQALPGMKYMIRGNHDYWWSSTSKMTAATNHEITFLQGHATGIGHIAFGGTRGYLCPGDSAFDINRDQHIYERELLRTEAALQEMDRYLATLSGTDSSFASKKGIKILLLHYPPFNDTISSSGFTELMDTYHVDHCIFGHLHDSTSFKRIPSHYHNTQLHLVSADFLNFTLKEIL